MSFQSKSNLANSDQFSNPFKISYEINFFCSLAELLVAKRVLILTIICGKNGRHFLVAKVKNAKIENICLVFSLKITIFVSIGEIQIDIFCDFFSKYKEVIFNEENISQLKRYNFHYNCIINNMNNESGILLVCGLLK